MPRAPEYQQIAHTEDAHQLSIIQDKNNRAFLDWMEMMCRRFRLETTDPGVGNDDNDKVEVGTFWFNTSTNDAWVNVDNTPGAAVWSQVSNGGVPAVATAVILSNGSATAVTDNTQTTVDTYTTTNAESITKIFVSGDANATWTVEIGGTERFEWRAADGNKTRDIDFPTPLTVAASTTIDIKVEHFFTGETADFKATIVGFT